MGFLTKALSFVQALAPVLRPVAAAVGIGAAFGVGEAVVGELVGGEPTTAMVPVPATVAQTAVVPLNGGAVTVNAVTGQPVLGPQIAGVIGRGNVRFRTVIQRISIATGQVISQELKPGKPWLMASEVAALKRVSGAVNRAHGKIPRKPSKTTFKGVAKGVQDFAQVQLMLQALQNGKSC